MRSSSSTPVVRVLTLIAAVVVFAALALWSLSWANFIGLDFRVYRMGGQSVVDGDGSLYTRSFGEGEGSLLFTYPPFAALLFTALTLVSAETGAVIFVALSVLTALATAVNVARYSMGLPSVRAVLGHPVALPAAIAGAGLICLLGPWRETMAFAQINILLFALIIVDLLSGPHRRWPTGMLTGIAAGIKLTPLVFGLYFLMRGEWRELRNMAAGFFGTIGLGFLLLPSESRIYWLQMLRDTGRIGGEGYVDNLSVRGAILHFGGPDFPSFLPWLGVSLALVAAAAYVIRGAHARGDRFIGMTATALLMLLISPISWSHHWVWIAIILPVLAAQFFSLPESRKGYRYAAGVLFVLTLPVFIYSPKTIGTLLGAEDLNSQLTTGWLMASSAGVFCGLAILVFWVLLTRALSSSTGGPATGGPAVDGATGGPAVAEWAAARAAGKRTAASAAGGNAEAADAARPASMPSPPAP